MLGSLIKEDFIDPDPDDGGQLRYEMEKLKVPPLSGSPFELQNRINTILEFLNKLSEADKLKIKAAQSQQLGVEVQSGLPDILKEL